MEESEILIILENINFFVNCLYRLIKKFLFYVDLELLLKDRDRLEFFKIGIISNFKLIIREVVFEKVKVFNCLKDLDIKLENVDVKIFEFNFRKIIDELLDNVFKFFFFYIKVEVIGKLLNNVFVVYFIDNGIGMSINEIYNVGVYK